MRRRTFLGVISAGAAGVLTGGLSKVLAAIPEASGSMSTSMSKTFLLGGDLLVNRLGFGAMRLTGEGIWGWPPDRENAKKVLRLIHRATASQPTRLPLPGLRLSYGVASSRSLMHRKRLMMEGR